MHSEPGVVWTCRVILLYVISRGRSLAVLWFCLWRYSPDDLFLLVFHVFFLVYIFSMLTTDPDLLASCFRCIGVHLIKFVALASSVLQIRTPVSSRFVVIFFIFTGIIYFFFATHLWALLYAFNSSLGLDHWRRAHAGHEESMRGFEWLH